MILISYTKSSIDAKSELYITTDGAASKPPFRKVVLGFVIDGPLIFHPREENWILVKGISADPKTRRLVKVCNSSIVENFLFLTRFITSLPLIERDKS